MVIWPKLGQVHPRRPSIVPCKRTKKTQNWEGHMKTILGEDYKIWRVPCAPEQRTIFHSSKFDYVNWGPELSKAFKNVVGRHLTTHNRVCVFAGLCMAGFFHPCGGPSNFILSSIQFKEPGMQGIRFSHSFDRWTVKLYTRQHHSEPGAPKRQSCPQLTPAGVTLSSGTLPSPWALPYTWKSSPKLKSCVWEAHLTDSVTL